VTSFSICARWRDWMRSISSFARLWMAPMRRMNISARSSRVRTRMWLSKATISV
jgi:hypothetical protein